MELGNRRIEELRLKAQDDLKTLSEKHGKKLENLAAARCREIDELVRMYREGKISRREYNKQLREIQKKYDAEDASLSRTHNEGLKGIYAGYVANMQEAFEEKFGKMFEPK